MLFEKSTSSNSTAKTFNEQNLMQNEQKNTQIFVRLPSLKFFEWGFGKIFFQKIFPHDIHRTHVKELIFATYSSAFENKYPPAQPGVFHIPGIALKLPAPPKGVGTTTICMG
ncbi:MAG: hypothetical protein J6I50_09645 [Clostridia bacterium]|nr:hypothetical protein [Clostridia bacterium]